jgi:hypothetical protein
MRQRYPWLAVVVLVAQAMALPCAYATPPDSASFSGLWDDDDYDDIVEAVVQAVGALETILVARPDPDLVSHGVLQSGPRRILAAAVHATYQLRAPPLA